MDQNKVIHALLYAITEFPSIGKTQLMKYVLFCDLFSYNTKRTTVLENQYTKMPNGPVPQYAFSIASESNRFFSVTRPRRSLETTKYRANIKPDMAMFSQYEKSLLNFVLETVRRKTARSVSTFSHMQFWEGAEDLSEIDLENFKLSSEELAKLQEYGFFFPDYQKYFCWNILEKSAMITKLIQPLDRDKIVIIEDFLDCLLREFPKSDLSIFYDAYLAWDDVYRTATRQEPQLIPEIANEFCDVFSTIIMETHVRKQTLDPHQFTEFYENKLNYLHDQLVGKRVSSGTRVPPTSIFSKILSKDKLEIGKPT